MHRILTHTTLALALSAIGLAPSKAAAAITVTHFGITADSITLTFNGTLPDTAPIQSKNTIVLINTDTSAGYVFSQANFIPAATKTFSGTDLLTHVQAGRQQNGDYTFASFATDLVTGQIFTGTITATWTNDILHPEFITDLSNLKLYWGLNSSSELTSGVFLADMTAVPEPATVALLSAGAAALVAVAVRRRRNKA